MFCTTSTLQSLLPKSYGNPWRKKYKIEDAGMKKFIVGRFLDFKMVDSISVVKQLEEIQVITN